VTPAVLAHADVIALAQRGAGGNCSFSDGTRTVSFRWDPSGLPQSRDPHVLAQGTINGAAYAEFFGVPIADLVARDPAAATPEGARVSFLLIRLRDDLDVTAGLEVGVGRPELTWVGFLTHYTNIGIYTGRLSYPKFSIPGVTAAPVDGSHTVVLPLPRGSFEFSQWPGSAAFTFEVTSAGTVDYDHAFDEFVFGRGSTKLTVIGPWVEIDATKLSHDLLPAVAGASGLTRQETHWLHLVPATGYGFMPAEGVVADFRFDVRPDGTVVVDPTYAGFANFAVETLSIQGYPVTIDTRGLLEDLAMVKMIGPVDPLPHGVVNVRTLIPASGYLLRSTGPSATEFRLTVTTSGAVHPA
jgi:hypothetical protein